MNIFYMAVAVGFEPTVELPPHTLSRRAPSGRSDTPPLENLPDEQGRLQNGPRRRDTVS